MMNFFSTKRTFSEERGFTIIEMLIALVIVGLLSTLVIINFSGFNVNTVLNSEAEQLSATLRQAQLSALTGQTRGGQRPAGGWGVHIEQCTGGSCVYTIFADSWPAGAPNRTFDNGFDAISKEVFIEDVIRVFSVNPVSAGELDIVFAIPDGGVYLNGDIIDATANIVLEHVNSGTQRTVVIDRTSGRITVQ